MFPSPGLAIFPRWSKDMVCSMKFRGYLTIRTCCDRRSTDWDEFMLLPGCVVGIHSDEKPVKPVIKLSITAAPDSAPVRILPTEPESTSAPQISRDPSRRPQVPWVSASGLNECRHIGCQMEYKPESNADDSCRYHSGSAQFKDTRKYWTCCNATSYDWETFLYLPKCSQGKHQPKMIDSDN
jgi:hypothetical protein